MKKTLTWITFFGSLFGFTLYLYNLDPSTPFQAFFTACFLSVCVALIILCIYKIKWRYDNGVDLFATLETDEEKLKKHMLFIMQYHGIEENLKELNEIFRNYPQWELQNWEVFRAWYKNQIDHMLEYPEIYNMTMKADGTPYRKENDSLYDPDAPDWSLFDRDHSDDDNDDDSDDTGSHGGHDNKGKLSDALAIGMGIGLANGITGGSVFGGGSSGSGN